MPNYRFHGSDSFADSNTYVVIVSADSVPDAYDLLDEHMQYMGRMDLLIKCTDEPDVVGDSGVLYSDVQSTQSGISVVDGPEFSQKICARCRKMKTIEDKKIVCDDCLSHIEGLVQSQQ